MKLVKKLVVVALLFIATATVSAQQYTTGVGARLGFDNGFTIKHFFAQTSAVEGLLAVSSNYFQLGGLYEFQKPIEGASGLEWYLGVGAHSGSITKNRSSYDSSFLLGADIIGGLEYKIPAVPFSLSLDWKPTFNFTSNYNDDWFAGFALSLRYTID